MASLKLASVMRLNTSVRSVTFFNGVKAVVGVVPSEFEELAQQLFEVLTQLLIAALVVIVAAHVVSKTIELLRGNRWLQAAIRAWPKLPLLKVGKPKGNICWAEPTVDT